MRLYDEHNKGRYELGFDFEFSAKPIIVSKFG